MARDTFKKKQDQAGPREWTALGGSAIAVQACSGVKGKPGGGGTTARHRISSSRECHNCQRAYIRNDHASSPVSTITALGGSRRTMNSIGGHHGTVQKVDMSSSGKGDRPE
jgi:hypothetical protein